MGKGERECDLALTDQLEEQKGSKDSLGEGGSADSAVQE